MLPRHSGQSSCLSIREGKAFGSYRPPPPSIALGLMTLILCVRRLKGSQKLMPHKLDRHGAAVTATRAVFWRSNIAVGLDLGRY